MTRQKASDPERRMGIYKQLTDVPAEDRLARYADRYAGRDVWAAFQQQRSNDFSSTHYRQTITKTERSWKSHMRDRERHHALARPRDVEAWCRELATTRQIETVYTQYWVRLEEFYTWLQFHTSHPHRYQPVLMAAATFETAGQVWDAKLGALTADAAEEGATDD